MRMLLRMKKSWFVLIWTILFIFLGIFIHSKTNELSSKYINEFTNVEYSIKSENWNDASKKVSSLSKSLENEKCTWYKLINHGYFNEVFMSLEILKQSISMKDKMICLQEIEKIKMIFNNLEEDECCDFNRIF